jgi:hypothetical protein
MMRGYSASRDVTPNFLQAFDVDDGRAPCPMRTQTVTAPQALFLMNSPDVDKACAEFASRLQKETAGDLPSAVDLAYRMTLSRPPSSAERVNALAYLENDPTRLKQLGGCCLIRTNLSMSNSASLLKSNPRWSGSACAPAALRRRGRLSDPAQIRVV